MKKEYKKLELDKVLALLAEEAWSAQSRENILAIEPKTEAEEIAAEIKKTDDAFILSSRFGTPRFMRISNMCSAVKRASSGSSLGLRELLNIGSVLKDFQLVSSWYSQCENIETSLKELFDEVIPDKPLCERIEATIISEEEISDNASPELSRIRKSILRESANIREQLDRIIRSQNTAKFLQENIVTMRDGRYVVPVKSEYKNEIGGLVHDTSASGQTFFIEPISVVEANNEIRILKSKEAAEIERIIAELSASVGMIASTFIRGYESIMALEVYFAKANFGAKLKGIPPEITEEPVIVLKRARHPLISQKTVVPISLTLGESFSCLVVTGPNTGGKTVALKTTGLLTLMAMCGMLIPAESGSKIGVFTNIFPDIGDEQSIEQSLSTFSSHMNNIISIMKSADEKSLILLDELGSGTDPVEGAALAVSVLTDLKEKGCRILATTHYQEVKLFAIQTPGVENACCEFDVATLMPTYNLIIGVPGKSNAFAIAKRLGMEDYIIEESQRLVSSENRRFEEVVEALEASRQELEAVKRSISDESRKTTEIRAELEKEKKQFEEQKERELAAARQKAMRMVEQVRYDSEHIMEQLEQLKKEKDKADFSDNVKRSKGALKSSISDLYNKADPVSEKKEEHYVLPRPLKAYDTVRLADIDKKGSLLTLPDKDGNCFVQVGVIKTKTKLSNLRLEEREEAKLNGKAISAVKTGGAQRTVTSNADRVGGMELDIRGMTGDDGISALDKFIDDALMSGLHVLTVIHGKGTGALRTAVHQYLRRNKFVKSFRLGEYGEGDAGVTVIEIGK